MSKKGGKRNDNVVLIGRKPVMNYVLACITQLTSGDKEIEIKARGRSISRAVDVAEILRNRFMNDLKVKTIDIGTEEIETEDGSKLNVSAITIKLSK